MPKLRCRLCLLLDFGETFAAVYGTVFPGLERNLAGLAACCAYSIKHFTLWLAGILTCVAARLASLGLVYETLLCIEFLLASSKNKFLATFFAN